MIFYTSGIHRKKRIVCILLMGISLVAMFLLVWHQVNNDREEGTVTNVRIESADEAIRISWDAPFISKVDHVEIRVADHDGNICDTVSVKPQEKSYNFLRGEMNKAYEVTVSVVYKDGQEEQLASEKRMLLDMDALPDLPVLSITTYSGNDPTATFVEAGDGQVGKTIKDKTHEEGVLVYSSSERTVEARITIEIRGNTSAVPDKKPYKITLDRGIDLLDFDGEHSYTEWLLLSSGSSLNNYLGQCGAEYCGMEWVAEGRSVNVFLNGDWKGLYTLSEPVSRESSHGLVSENGYIMENDAYWWNADGIYFKLDDQLSAFGYTFKYPKMDAQEDGRIEEMRKLLQTFTDLCKKNDPDTWNYADMDTFVSWMVTHDLMQWADQAGANSYYYIYDYTSEEEEDRILKMGPVWDCDGVANGKDYNGEHGLSKQHYVGINLFVENADFLEAYQQKWDELSGGVAPLFQEKLQELYETEGDALNASRSIDAERWGISLLRVEDEGNTFETWINDQVDWMNSYWGNR